jgi:hypothetical protein
MVKELGLIIGVMASFVLYFFTFTRMEKLALTKPAKLRYTYLTLLIPVLGFALVYSTKSGRIVS